MKDYLKSFFFPYYAVPIFFYSVDLACQASFYEGEGWELFPLTTFLTFAAGIVFMLILRQKWITVAKPWVAAAGAFIGLLQGFTIYLGVGTNLIWHRDAFEGQPWTKDDLRDFIFYFFQPWFNYSSFVCDGAGLAVILSGIVFCVIVHRSQKNVRN